PAAMAQVSLRPVREDLAAAGAAIEGLVRALGGGVLSSTTTATLRYDEERRESRWEVRYAVAGAPSVRLLRVEMRAFRNAAPPGRPLRLAYAAGGEPPRPVPPGSWLELEPAPRGVTVVLGWAEPAPVQALRPRFRLLVFEHLDVTVPGRSDDALVTAV